MVERQVDRLFDMPAVPLGRPANVNDRVDGFLVDALP